LNEFIFIKTLNQFSA